MRLRLGLVRLSPDVADQTDRSFRRQLSPHVVGLRLGILRLRPGLFGQDNMCYPLQKTNNHLDFSQEIKPSMVREKITMIATT